MGAEMGTITTCLDRAVHRADWTAFSPPLAQSGIQRVEFVRKAILAASTHLRKIEEAAKKDDLEEVKRLLNEQFQFGG